MTPLPVLKASYTVRPCTLNDLDAVVVLMKACDMAAIGESNVTAEEILTDWQRPGFDQAMNQRVIMTADERTATGWVQLESSQKVILFVDIYVHPDHVNEGIGEYLYAWAENCAHERFSQARVGARIVLRAYTHASEKDAGYSALLRAHGMQLIRHAWHMEMNLDVPPPEPVWPEAITLKIYQAGDDKRPIFAVRRETFQDQFGYVERPFEEHYAQWLHYWESDQGFMPELWLMAMDGEQIVGINLCKSSQNGDEDLGWVSSLGIRREYRRRGIGEALLYTGFKALYAMGKKRVGLAVDASSLTGAATLYKRAGMHIAKQFDLYEKELRPGDDLTTHG